MNTYPNEDYSRVRKFLRRKNFSRWALNNPREGSDEIMLALDLLTQRAGDHVPRLREYRDAEFCICCPDFKFAISKKLAGILKQLHLVTWERNDIEEHFSYYLPTEQANAYFFEFLRMHDAMHVGDTHEIVPGVYRHFKGADRLYNVLWTSCDSVSGDLSIEYQPLHTGDGGKNNREFLHDHRPLADFTQVIHRPDTMNYFGPRFWLVTAHDVPKIAPFLNS